MAAINVPVKGLTGLINVLSLDTANTIAQVATAASTAEGLTSSYYEVMSLERDPDENSVDTPTTTLATLNFDENSDVFFFKPLQEGQTKEYLQVQRLDIAQLKRQGGPGGDTNLPCYRVKNTYDITSLPTQYSGNTIVDNPNPDGLLLGRPWIAVSVNPNPTGIDDAVSGETLTKLEGQFQGDVITSIVPTASEDSQITQWTDQSDFSHNLNSTGSQKARYRTIPATKNGYGFVYFNGTSSCMTINPVPNLVSQNKVTIFMAGRILEDTGTVFGSEPSTNTELELATVGGSYSVNFGTSSATTGIARDANWHVFTMIYDGTQGTNATKLRLRIDSADIPLTFTGTVPTTTSAVNNTITLGCKYGGGNFCEMEAGAFFVFLGDELTSIEIQNVENLLTNEWV